MNLNIEVDVRDEAQLLLVLPEATLPVSVTTLNDSGGERVLDSLDSGGLEIEMEHLRIGDSKLLDLVKDQAVGVVLLVRKEEGGSFALSHTKKKGIFPSFAVCARGKAASPFH